MLARTLGLKGVDCKIPYRYVSSSFSQFLNESVRGRFSHISNECFVP